MHFIFFHDNALTPAKHYLRFIKDKHNTRYHNIFKENVEMILLNSILESDYFWIWHFKKSTRGTTSNLKASAQQRKQLTKWKTTEWEKNFTNYILSEELKSKIYIALRKLNRKKIQLENKQTNKTDFFKEDVQMANS